MLQNAFPQQNWRNFFANRLFIRQNGAIFSQTAHMLHEMR